MTRVADIVHEDSKASSGKYRSETEVLPNGVTVRNVYHYTTRMLTFEVNPDGTTFPNPPVHHMSTGIGSVSDQQSMNQWFQELRLPYRFSRAGGASIVR